MNATLKSLVRETMSIVGGALFNLFGFLVMAEMAFGWVYALYLYLNHRTEDAWMAGIVYAASFVVAYFISSERTDYGDYDEHTAQQ